MKISAEISSKLYRTLIKFRNNTKGKLTEVEFNSFLHTVNVINDAIFNEVTSIGAYNISNYRIADNFKELILPREVKREAVNYFINVKDYGILEGHTEITDNTYSTKSDGTTQKEIEVKYAERLDEYEQAKSKGDNDSSKLIPRPPIGDAVSLLSPTEFDEIQEIIFLQMGKEAKLNSIALEEKRKTQTITSAIIGKLSFDGTTKDDDTTSGFRPIAVITSMFPDINLRYFVGDAVQNFETWFKCALLK